MTPNPLVERAARRGGRPPWDHNRHYHQLVLESLPPGAARALDVGCGSGLLARELAARVPEVVGLDRDEASIMAATAEGGPPGLRYVIGDVLNADLGLGQFDLVSAVACVHHLEMGEALRRLDQLVRPGGRLVVVGVARSTDLLDFLIDIAAVVANCYHRTVKRYVDQTSPVVWPPPLSYGQVRRLSATVLPGSQYRRRLLFRYTLIWAKPL